MPDVPLNPRSLTPAFAPGGPDRHARPRTSRGRLWVVLPGRDGGDPTGRLLVSVWPDAPRDEATAGAAPLVRLAEPCDRGTAATALRVAHWVRWRDPTAVMTLLLGATSGIDWSALRTSLSAAALFVGKHPSWSVVLDGWEPEHPRDWIEPGEPFGLAGRHLLRRVRRLTRDGPDSSRTRALVCRASALAELGQRCLPEISEALTEAAGFAGPVEDSWLLRKAYASSASRDVLRDLLPRALPHVAVGRLRAVTAPAR